MKLSLGNKRREFQVSIYIDMYIDGVEVLINPNGSTSIAFLFLTSEQKTPMGEVREILRDIEA